MRRTINKLQQANFILAGFFTALALLAAIAWTTTRGLADLEESERQLRNSTNLLLLFEHLMSTLKDAETGVRGFVVTGDRSFARPYDDALKDLPSITKALADSLVDHPAAEKLPQLNRLIDQRLAELHENLELRSKSDGPRAVIARMVTGRGKALMDQIRAQVDAMQTLEAQRRAERAALVERNTAKVKAFLMFGGSAAGLILILNFWFLRQENLRRQATALRLQETNRALTQQSEQLEAMNRELEGFSYSVSHDLRIPLRAVDGYARMVEEDYASVLDSEGRRMLEVIRNNATRMGALIDDLLQFSRLSRKAMSMGPINMNSLVNEFLTETERTSKTPRPLMTIDTLPAAWGDRSLLYQVWSNLLSNAIKYSSRVTTPQVKLSAQASDTEIIYCVEDNGAGFDMQYYDKLFGVFQRLHTVEEFPGTGVGLAIVQRIVTRHGGRIWAESQVNAGARFYFALPRYHEPDELNPPTQPHPTNLANETSDSHHD